MRTEPAVGAHGGDECTLSRSDVGPSVDVDRPEDVAAAERLLGLTGRAG